LMDLRPGFVSRLMFNGWLLIIMLEIPIARYRAFPHGLYRDRLTEMILTIVSSV